MNNFVSQVNAFQQAGSSCESSEEKWRGSST